MEQHMECSTDDEENILSLLEYLPSDVLLEIFTFLDWNDLCQVACTCTKFRDICKASSLWLSLRYLDFRNCAIPIPEKILQVLNRTPNASHIVLGQVITDEKSITESSLLPFHGNLTKMLIFLHMWRSYQLLVEGFSDEMNEEEEEEPDANNEQNKDNLKPSDRFVLNVLKSCPKISHLELCMSEITDMSINAICAKCTVLQKLELCDNSKINKRSLYELVSLSTTLRELVLDGCDGLNFIELAHTDPSRHLALQKVSIRGLQLVLSNVVTLINSCPLLTYLNLTGCVYLDSFVLDPPGPDPQVPIARAALESLQEIIISCPGMTKVFLPYCPNLSHLDVSSCTYLTEIVGNFPALHQLETGDCEYNSFNKIALTKSCLQKLSCKNMASLETLEIASDDLSELNVKSCAKLSAAQILSAVVNKQCLTSLDISGCKNISPTDVNEVLLPQLPSLQSLHYGGHSWNNVDLKSSNIKDLQYSDCIITTCILLKMPQLQTLTLQKCRDFSEQELMDSFLHGKLVTRMQGLGNLVAEHREQPFIHDSGIPCLSFLKFIHLPGLHGDVISHALHHFSHLKTVEFINCTFLCNLSVNGWPSLSALKIESCNALCTLSVEQIPTLQTLSVKWCSMLQMCSIQAESLKTFDTTGTNFATLSVICDSLPSLHLNGVCTQPLHKLSLRCKNLEELSITKCDRLTDDVLDNIFRNNASLKSVNLIGSLSLKSMCLPESTEVCSLTGHRMLKELKTSSLINIKHLTLNNLPKFVPSERLCFLKQCERSLKVLEVRAIPGETTLCLQLQGLHSLTLDQGIHLASLEISCPKLKYLRIQGCPKLVSLTLHVESLTKMQVYHSTPLLALRRLTVHSKHVVHLARVLAHYTPKLEELFLHGSEVRGSQLYRLGQSLHELQTVILDHCDVSELDNHGTSLLLNSATIDRPNNKHLLVQFVD